jgi:hypothetical protein
MPDEAPIKVNRAPVLTLWAPVVAERLGQAGCSMAMATTAASASRPAPP